MPVINGLTDYSHPCQAMADLMTVEEHFGNLNGQTLAFVGDGNNVARSLAVACGRFGMRFVLASPSGYELPRRGRGPDDVGRRRSWTLRSPTTRATRCGRPTSSSPTRG